MLGSNMWEDEPEVIRLANSLTGGKRPLSVENTELGRALGSVDHPGM